MLSLADLGTKYRQTILSNNTRVVVFERPGTPIHLRACFLSGSRFDDSKEGTAHFLEHMVVAGTKNFPSKDLLSSYIEQYGGVFGASTSSDSLDIYMGIGDPNDLNIILKVLHEMLFESLFDEKILETERGSILGELRERLSNPKTMVWDVAERLIFQGTPLAKSTIGTPQDIEAITKKGILEFFHKNITAGRMILVVSGGITMEDIAKEAENLLLLPSSIKPIFDKQLPIIREETIDIERYIGKDQVHIIVGFRTAPAHHSDAFALDLIAQVLGGGRASVLAKELRYNRGLVYGVGAYQHGFVDAGMWAVKTSTAKEKLQEVLDIITATIARVATQGLTDSEIQFAKNKIIKSKRMELQTSASWVNFHAYKQLLSPEPWTFIDYLQGISKVTSEDIRRVAKKYFGHDKWYLAMCGDITKDEVAINW